jgi:hypothetical protein
MNSSDLIQRLSEAASHSMAAATGNSVDENGRPRLLNLFDTRRHASKSTEILNEVIQELESAGATSDNS